jgi:hypothetical protein
VYPSGLSAESKPTKLVNTRITNRAVSMDNISQTSAVSRIDLKDDGIFPNNENLPLLVKPEIAGAR